MVSSTTASSAALITLFLSLLSAAPSNANANPATPIALSHNTAHHLTRRDGNGAWLVREKAKLDTKYGGADIVVRRHDKRTRRRAEVDSVGRRDGTGRRSLHKRAGDVTLADHYSDASYSASISIGTPAQSLDVAIDTGSSDLWVADTSCSKSSSSCSSLPVFATTDSSSLKNSSTGFGISYGSGTASGTLATDTVALGGYSVVSQTIALVDDMSTSLIAAPMSGIFGFGFQSLAVSGATPWWQSLASSSAWSEPLFGVYLARYRDVPGAASTEAQGGKLTLGYLDSSLYSGDITYVSVTEQRYWNVPIAAMSMQGTTIDIGSSNAAAIDTGTTLIGGPADIVAKIYAAIPGAKLMGSSYPNYYEYPCSTKINFKVKFGDYTVTVTDQDFNIGRYSSDQSMCTGGVYIQSLSSSSPIQWVVGDTLLKNTYTVFRASPAAVGFAALAGEVTSSAAGLSTGIPSGTALPGATSNGTSTAAASSSSGSTSGASSSSSVASSSASTSSSASIGMASSTSSTDGGVTVTASNNAPAENTSTSSAPGRPEWHLASHLSLLAVMASILLTIK